MTAGATTSADGDLDAREIAVELGASTFAHGLVVDTRVYSPIAELAPAQASDCGASNMQHMAVVRDFDIPTETTASVHVDAPNGGERWTIGSTPFGGLSDGVSFNRSPNATTGPLVLHSDLSSQPSSPGGAP